MKRGLAYMMGQPSGPLDEGAREDVFWFRVEYYGIGDEELIPRLIRALRVRYERQAGTWLCSGLISEGGELTATTVERLRLGALLAHVAEHVATATETEPPRITAPKRRGPKGFDDDFYREVAELYKRACDHPAAGFAGRPVKWMAEHAFGQPVKRSTVVDWLDKAGSGRRKFLRRNPGRAGYIDSDRKEDS